MKWDKLLEDWTTHLKKLSKNKEDNTEHAHFKSKEISSAIANLFENVTENELMSQVCKQIYNNYRCKNKQAKYQCIGALPILIYAYLISHVDRLLNHEIEACILGIYNLEVTDKDGSIKTETVQLPDFSTCSVYHDPLHLTSPLSDQSTTVDKIVVNIGRHALYERIDGTNRYKILSRVLQVYNKSINKCDLISHRQVCRIVKRLMTRGFTMDSLADSLDQLRIPLHPSLLVEFIQSIYFIIYNGNLKRGQMALRCLHKRSEYEIFPSVLMITSSILDELALENSQSADTYLSVKALKASIAKDQRITNASFRSKKLPEDIQVNGTIEVEFDLLTDSDIGMASNDGKLKTQKRKQNLKTVIKQGDNCIKIGSDNERIPQTQNTKEFHIESDEDI